MYVGVIHMITRQRVAGLFATALMALCVSLAVVGCTTKPEAETPAPAANAAGTPAPMASMSAEDRKVQEADDASAKRDLSPTK